MKPVALLALLGLALAYTRELTADEISTDCIRDLLIKYQTQVQRGSSRELAKLEDMPGYLSPLFETKWYQEAVSNLIGRDKAFASFDRAKTAFNEFKAYSPQEKTRIVTLITQELKKAIPQELVADPKRSILELAQIQNLSSGQYTDFIEWWNHNYKNNLDTLTQGLTSLIELQGGELLKFDSAIKGVWPKFLSGLFKKESANSIRSNQIPFIQNLEEAGNILPKMPLGHLGINASLSFKYFNKSLPIDYYAKLLTDTEFNQIFEEFLAKHPEGLDNIDWKVWVETTGDQIKVKEKYTKFSDNRGSNILGFLYQEGARFTESQWGIVESRFYKALNSSYFKFDYYQKSRKEMFKYLKKLWLKRQKALHDLKTFGPNFRKKFDIGLPLESIMLRPKQELPAFASLPLSLYYENPFPFSHWLYPKFEQYSKTLLTQTHLTKEEKKVVAVWFLSQFQLFEPGYVQNLFYEKVLTGSKLIDEKANATSDTRVFFRQFIEEAQFDKEFRQALSDYLQRLARYAYDPKSDAENAKLKKKVEELLAPKPEPFSD